MNAFSRDLLTVPTLEDVREAEQRIRPFIHRTPVFESRSLNGLTKTVLFFKCENLQRSGAFKARGAFNAVMSLPAAAAVRGVVTHSSGNHGAAVALAARTRGIPAYVVVTETAVKAKIENIRRYGARLVFCRPTLEEREKMAAEIASKRGAHIIHPYDDGLVVAGQGTVVGELFSDVGTLDVVVVPFGGGGLLSGVALASTGTSSRLCVVGVRPEDRQATIADGLRVSPKLMTSTLIERYVDNVVAVSEQSIVRALELIRSVLKLVVEPSAAVPLAAILDRERSEFLGKRVGIVLTGGNCEGT